MSENKKIKKNNNKQFFCPLGKSVMWHHKLEYKECPLNPSYRDMSECKGCKLRVDKKWEDNKEKWQDKFVKRKKRPKKHKKKQGNRR